MYLNYDSSFMICVAQLIICCLLYRSKLFMLTLCLNIPTTNIIIVIFFSRIQSQPVVPQLSLTARIMY